MVSANLACALASSTRRKILLLEGDVRRPSLSKVFGLKAHPGLCEWLEGGRSLASSIYRLEPGGIWLFPAGHAPANPLELLESAKLPALMEQLAAWFDWVIIDSPPVLPLADTSVWTRLADGILLVTRQGTTQKRHLQRGLEALESKKVIGAVLNSSKNSSDNEYYSYRRPPEGTQRTELAGLALRSGLGPLALHYGRQQPAGSEPTCEQAICSPSTRDAATPRTRPSRGRRTLMDIAERGVIGDSATC